YARKGQYVTEIYTDQQLKEMGIWWPEKERYQMTGEEVSSSSPLEAEAVLNQLGTYLYNDKRSLNYNFHLTLTASGDIDIHIHKGVEYGGRVYLILKGPEESKRFEEGEVHLNYFNIYHRKQGLGAALFKALGAIPEVNKISVRATAFTMLSLYRIYKKLFESQVEPQVLMSLKNKIASLNEMKEGEIKTRVTDEIILEIFKKIVRRYAHYNVEFKTETYVIPLDKDILLNTSLGKIVERAGFSEVRLVIPYTLVGSKPMYGHHIIFEARRTKFSSSPLGSLVTTFSQTSFPISTHWKLISDSKAMVYFGWPGQVEGVDSRKIKLPADIKVVMRINKDAKPGFDMFLRHIILKILDNYFLKKRIYTVEHIPLPLGYFRDRYYYVFAEGSEGWPTVLIDKDSDYRKTPVMMEELHLVKERLYSWGFDIWDIVDADGEDGKNIIHKGWDISRLYENFQLSKDWVLIDLDGLVFRGKRFFQSVGEAREGLKRNLGWQYELLVLAGGYIDRYPRTLFGGKERRLKELAQRYLDEVVLPQILFQSKTLISSSPVYRTGGPALGYNEESCLLAPYKMIRKSELLRLYSGSNKEIALFYLRARPFKGLHEYIKFIQAHVNPPAGHLSWSERFNNITRAIDQEIGNLYGQTFKKQLDRLYTVLIESDLLQGTGRCCGLIAASLARALRKLGYPTTELYIIRDIYVLNGFTTEHLIVVVEDKNNIKDNLYIDFGDRRNVPLKTPSRREDNNGLASPSVAGGGQKPFPGGEFSSSPVKQKAIVSSSPVNPSHINKMDLEFVHRQLSELSHNWDNIASGNKDVLYNYRKPEGRIIKGFLDGCNFINENLGIEFKSADVFNIFLSKLNLAITAITREAGVARMSWRDKDEGMLNEKTSRARKFARWFIRNYKNNKGSEYPYLLAAECFVKLAHLQLFDEANKRTACLLLNFILLNLTGHYCVLNKEIVHKYFKISDDIVYRLGGNQVFLLNDIWERRLIKQFAGVLNQNSQASSSPVKVLDIEGIKKIEAFNNKKIISVGEKSGLSLKDFSNLSGQFGNDIVLQGRFKKDRFNLAGNNLRFDDCDGNEFQVVMEKGMPVTVEVLGKSIKREIFPIIDNKFNQIVGYHTGKISPQKFVAFKDITTYTRLGQSAGALFLGRSRPKVNGERTEKERPWARFEEHGGEKVKVIV
ncbi:MAG: hypothetical protein PHC37_07210, partial [Candidatus Omnitrophica bacterium]|nr:hypothetical protein [Candidatus Omnitrophota bacterium]